MNAPTTSETQAMVRRNVITLYTITYGDTGHSYDTIFSPYLQGAKLIVIEDPYIRMPHQITNFVRFCETVVKAATVRRVTLITSFDQQTDLAGLQEKLDELKQSLLEYDVDLERDDITPHHSLSF